SATPNSLHDALPIWIENCSDSRLQSFARNLTAPGALAANVSGPRGFGVASHYPRIFSANARHRETKREPGRGHFAKSRLYRKSAWHGENSESQTTRVGGLRVLQGHAAVQPRAGIKAPQQRL